MAWLGIGVGITDLPVLQHGSGGTPTPTPTITIIDQLGDSITAWGGGYADMYGAEYPALTRHDRAVGGVGLTGTNSPTSQKAAILAAAPGVVSLLIGANDLASGYASGTAYFAAIRSNLTDDLRAAGIKVVLCAILPQASNSVHNAKAIEFNQLAAGQKGQTIDGFVDWRLSQMWQPDGPTAAADTTKYGDGVHPTDGTGSPASNGHALLYPLYRNIMNVARGARVGITPPVLTKTSASGASPVTFSANFPDTTISAGMYAHLTVASDSAFKTVLQDETVQIDLDWFNNLHQISSYFTAINFTGTIYIRMEIISDEPLNSGYDATTPYFTETVAVVIPVSSAQLSNTNGANKASPISVTGTPRVTYALTASDGVQYCVRLDTALSAKSHSEMRIDGFGGAWVSMSIVDSGQSLASGWPTQALRIICDNSASWLVSYNGNDTYYTAPASAIGDYVILEYDKTTGAFNIWQVHAGTPTLVLSSSLSSPPTTPTLAVGGFNAGSGGTINTGQGTFQKTPSSGYTTT